MTLLKVDAFEEMEGFFFFLLDFFLNSDSTYCQEQWTVASAACQRNDLLKCGFTPQAAPLSAEVRVHVRT